MKPRNAGYVERRVSMDSRSGPDPLTEAKVYIAYGRYEQAAELLEQAITAEPSRADIQSLLVQVRAKGKGWSPSLDLIEVVSSMLATIGIILLISFAAWSIEFILGWILVVCSVVLTLARVRQRRGPTQQ